MSISQEGFVSSEISSHGVGIRRGINIRSSDLNSIGDYVLKRRNDSAVTYASQCSQWMVTEMLDSGPRKACVHEATLSLRPTGHEHLVGSGL